MPVDRTERDELRYQQWLRFCDVIRADGTFNQEQALLELSDYEQFLGQCGQVYEHVTGGRITKQNTLAFEVIAEHDAVCSADTKRDIREAIDQLREYLQHSPNCTEASCVCGLAETLETFYPEPTEEEREEETSAKAFMERLRAGQEQPS